jgi:hypothetical protein
MRPITLIFTLAVALNLLPGTATADSGGGWTWPIRGPVVTTYRNGSDPYAAGQHRGVDIGAPVGARVVAATRGTVTFAGTVGSSGLTVAERTADGRFDLSYLHLASAAVHSGDQVGAGAVLGSVGTSGRSSADQPHLHFGVREAGSHTAYRDPLDFLPPLPAAEAPRPTPAPVPVAHPATPPEHPAAAHDPAPAAFPVPAALPAPTAHPSPVPSAGPHPAPATQQAPAPVLTAPSHGGLHPAVVNPNSVAIQSDHDAPAQPHPAVRHDGIPAPSRGPSSSTSPAATAHPPHVSHATGSHHATHPHHGIDLGWLAACLGLIAAATALGHPDGTRRIATRGHARIGALLRPASRGG